MANFQCSILLLLLVISSTSLAQINLPKTIHGRFISDGKSVKGVAVVNLVNEKETTSDSQGNFYIEAKAGDLLVISGREFEFTRYAFEDEDMVKDIVLITLITKAIELEEAVVNRYAHINSRSLGIIPANQKVYTPAEAKLASAQSGPVDFIVGTITGKIAQKKKEVEIEKKEFLLERLDILYTDAFYIRNLKIPADQIKAFKFFAADDKDLAGSIAIKNKSLIEFELSRLANQYLKFY